jgi:hypothetical protein
MFDSYRREQGGLRRREGARQTSGHGGARLKILKLDRRRRYPMMYADLKPGQFVRLKCGCEGFIEEAPYRCLSPQESFLFLFTKDHDDGSLEELYRDGRPRLWAFHGEEDFEETLPAEPAEPPEWWRDGMGARSPT